MTIHTTVQCSVAKVDYRGAAAPKKSREPDRLADNWNEN